MGVAAGAAAIGAGIGAAGSIGGGLIGASGAKKAAKAQERASQADIASREKIFGQQTALQEPFRQGGMAAQNRLMTLLGLDVPDMGTGQPTGGNAMMGANSMGLPVGNYDPGFSFSGANRDPGFSFSGANHDPGFGVVPGLKVDRNSPDFGKYARDFGMQDFQQDPGYEFRMSEGMKALERSAAARGNLLSGSMLKGIQRYGQDLGSQEYQNAYNRYQINRSNQLNPLQSLMGAGQSSANTLTSAAGQMGEGISQAINNGGAARASGYIGQANALSGALNGISNAAMQYPQMQAQNNFMNAYANRYGGGGSSTAGLANPSGAGQINTIYSSGGLFGN